MKIRKDTDRQEASAPAEQGSGTAVPAFIGHIREHACHRHQEAADGKLSVPRQQILRPLVGFARGLQGQTDEKSASAIIP